MKTASDGRDLRIELYSAPHYRLMFGDEMLGMLEKNGNGYIVNGKRKPVNTLKAAAKQIIDRKIKECIREREKYSKTLQLICGHETEAK
jgi:hypothetical protein